jgi:N-[(2S)-2-amino-2-carboxyethyl]-L-glutamate dehydrogenase
MGSETMLYLDHDDVVRACGLIDPVEIVRQTLVAHAEGDTVLPDEAYLEWETPEGHPARSLNMPSAIRSPVLVAGTKVINACPANVERGTARAAGLTVLFDVSTSHPSTILSGTYISALRTAAVSYLAVSVLLPAPVSMTLLGAGALAEAHLRLFASRCPSLERVAVHDHRSGVAADFCERLAYDVDIPLVDAPSASEAVRGADVVIPVTTTTVAYLERDWLDPPCVIVNVSLDDVTADLLLTASPLIVDDWNLIRADQRRLLGRLAADGLVVGPGEPRERPVRAVDAELGSVLADPSVFQPWNGDVAVINPFGLSVEDVGLAAAINRVATKHGWGIPLRR